MKRRLSPKISDFFLG